LKLPENLQFNTMWHGQSVLALIICRKLAESDVTAMPSVSCMEKLRWWYNRVAQFPIQQHWPFLPTWMRNIALHHLVQSKWKIGKRQSVLKRN